MNKADRQSHGINRKHHSDCGRRRVPCGPLLVTPVLLLTLTAGCISPLHTRMPVLWASHPQSERQAFQQQDPFPDPDLGPDMQSRPREYSRPRTAPRRAAEQRLLQGIPSGPEYAPPGDPRGGLRRPAAAY
ncbi:MAG: hypothetical protein RIK87_12920 [Fuerstiella sp.]